MSGKRPIELHYVLDEDTFLQASQALWRRNRRQRRIQVRGWLLAAALPATAFLALRYGMWFTFFAVIALALLHFVFDWPLTRAFARRGFRQLPAANQPFRWQIGEDGLRLWLGEGAQAQQAEIGWDQLTGITEDEAGFILHQPHNVHHWLPKAAFTDVADAQRFMELLRNRAPGFSR